jgi:hypothetical protein
VARLRRIDNTHGNTRGFWSATLEGTEYPTEEEIAAMEAASVLGEDSIPLSEDAGCLVARLAMPAVAVAVIDFQV